MTGQTTAGTASDGYLTPARPHVYRPDEPDPGYRTRCAVCGGGRGDALHVPVPRGGEGR